MHHSTKVFHVFFLPLCLLFLAGCTGQIHGEQLRRQGKLPLPPQQLLDLVQGNTLHITTFGEDITLYFDPSGRATARDYEDNRDSGRWDVSEGGELCFRFRKWWYGDLRCFSVWQEGSGWLLLRPDGGLAYTAGKLAASPAPLVAMAREQADGDKHRASFRKTTDDSSDTAADSQAARAAAPAARSSFRGSTTQAGPAGAEPAPAAAPSTGTPPATPPVPTMSQAELKSTVRWLARDCPGCNMEHADLRAADLVAADLQGTNLRGANLREANLRRAKLQGANLESAVLEQANLPGADLRQANLRNANLRGANLIRANLTGANLQGADLTGALLEGATGVR